MRGGGGVKKGQIFADVLYGWPLTTLINPFYQHFSKGTLIQWSQAFTLLSLFVKIRKLKLKSKSLDFCKLSI